ncbi:hypothetical protein [Streptomyces sp. NPDC085540]|uniref:hypothetical protein n=1 Tax=Streptomyces sp. NPDC085540 TaxID=3365730 RepID=UPI0037D3C7B4
MRGFEAGQTVVRRDVHRSGRVWSEQALRGVADTGEVLARVKDLRPVFGDRLRSAVLSNGTHAHDATRTPLSPR